MNDNLNTRHYQTDFIKQELSEFTKEFGLSLSKLKEDNDAKFSDTSNQFDQIENSFKECLNSS